MFYSNENQSVVAQYEHAWLAGHLAAHYGNADFETPGLPRHEWISGVCFHDWQYGMLDELPIGEMDRNVWLDMMQRGMQMELDSDVATLVARFHVLRLLDGRPETEATELVERYEPELMEQVADAGFSTDDFRFADRVTNLCDLISFNFSRSMKVSFSCTVFPSRTSNNTVAIELEFDGDKTVFADPWPFSIRSVTTIVPAFGLADYPKVLKPKMLEFVLRPR